jgi:hypothetical protein
MRQQLQEQLMQALCGRTNGREWGDDYGSCVPAILSAMEECVNELRRPSSPAPPSSWAGNERMQDLAGRLHVRLLGLLTFLRKHRSSFLKQPGLAPWAARDLYRIAGVEWDDIDATAPTLAQMLALVSYWEHSARRRVRRRPGPTIGVNLDVVEFVGLVLQREGIPITKGKSGYYGRVLAVVYRAAGLGARDVCRDIARAFNSQPALQHRRRRVCARAA